MRFLNIYAKQGLQNKLTIDIKGLDQSIDHALIYNRRKTFISIEIW
jgi:hypothetical protein